VFRPRPDRFEALSLRMFNSKRRSIAASHMDLNGIVFDLAIGSRCLDAQHAQSVGNMGDYPRPNIGGFLRHRDGRTAIHACGSLLDRTAEYLCANVDHTGRHLIRL
jgi:hypothetical protein